MTLKTETLGQNFAHFGQFEGSFLTILEVKKSRFLHIFKVVLDLFRRCLGFVFGVKRPIFVLFTTRN